MLWKMLNLKQINGNSWTACRGLIFALNETKKKSDYVLAECNKNSRNNQANIFSVSIFLKS